MEEIVDSTDIILVRRISRAEWERMPWHARKKLERSGMVHRPKSEPVERVALPEEPKRKPRATDAAISRCGRCGSWMLTECKVKHDSQSA